MNRDRDQELLQQVDRALKALPELQAPASLSVRVLAAINAREAVPWHRQAWSTWSQLAKVAILLLLGSLFGGICLGAYKLPHMASVHALKQQVLGAQAVFNAIWQTASVLVNASARMLHNLQPGLLAGCIAALILGYLLCVGLGTVYVRLAMARR